MPKKVSRDKPKSSQNRSARPRGGRRGDSVKGLLERARGSLFDRLASQKPAQDAWRAWLAERLPAPLVARITAVSERDGVLILGAESAAWAARLRYALADAPSEVNSVKVVVRVLPAAGP